MMNLWTFSTSSELQLQLCVSAAPPPDLNNKWFQKFGKKVPEPSPVENVQEQTVNSEKQMEDEKAVTNNYEDFFDTITSESTIPLDFVLNECTKNPELINEMSEKLPISTTEKLFNEIFCRKDIETFRTFIITYMPIFAKHHNSRLCIDLLVKINKYPPIFKQILIKLINDTEIPSQVLNNYISVLDEESSTDFMKTLSNIEITSEAFTQNVFSIYAAYKNCIKDNSIQNYIQNMIVKHSTSCACDRDFGRIFLIFLQTEKALGVTANIQTLKECLNIHKSPFKRPCFVILKEMTE